jgi:hypothetical protein
MGTMVRIEAHVSASSNEYREEEINAVQNDRIERDRQLEKCI